MIKKLLKPRVIGITIGVLVVVFVFYWFQLRPSQIRSQCVTESKTKSIDLKNKLEPNATFKDVFYTETYDNYFDRCLNEKGLSMGSTILRSVKLFA